MELNEKIRKYIEENMIAFDDMLELSDDDDIFKIGFVNSLFAMKLLNFIEKEFSILIDSDDIEIANFSTVNNIVKFIEKKR